MRWIVAVLVAVVFVGCKTPADGKRPEQEPTPLKKAQPSTKPETASAKKVEKPKPPKAAPKKEVEEPKDPLEQLKVAFAAAQKAHEAYFHKRLLERRYDESLLKAALEKVESALKLAQKLVAERPEDPFVRDAHIWLGQAQFALNEERLRHERLKKTEAETEHILKEGKKAEPAVEEKPAPPKEKPEGK